jgi:hypothetical protein
LQQNTQTCLIAGLLERTNLPNQTWCQPVGARFGLVITLDGATYALVCDLFYQSRLLQRLDMVINLLCRILEDLSQIITGTRFIEPAQYFQSNRLQQRHRLIDFFYVTYILHYSTIVKIRFIIKIFFYNVK